MTRRGTGKIGFLLMSLFILWLAVGQIGFAQPGFPGSPDGFETSVDNGVGTGFIHPGDTSVTQQVTLTDSDADANDITILEVVVDNLGNATAADIALIEILDGGGAVLGQINPGGFPVVIDIDPDFVIPDAGASVVNQILQVRCTVELGVTGRRTIQTQLTIRSAEGVIGFLAPFVSIVNDGNATTINNCPTADDDVAATNEDGPVAGIPVLPNDNDPDGDPLSITVNTTGTVGNVTLVGDTFTYAPNGQFEALAVGDTQDDTFEYTISDGDTTCGAVQRTATVTVTVTGVNDAPVAVNDADTTDEDTAIVVDVLANDTDVDTGDILVVQSLNTTDTIGCVTANPDNTITYDPCGQFEGLKVVPIDTFTYTVSDGNGGTATATVSITVTGLNDVPVVTNDIVGTNEDTAVIVDVLGNDTDVDDALVVGGVTQGANGTVTNNGNNVTYAPNADWCGVDTFTYTADDGTNAPVQGTVTVTVTCVNDAPVAANELVAVDEDSANNIIDVLANDTDVDLADLLFVDAIVTLPTNGAVVNNGVDVSYTPGINFVGNDWFEYRVADGNGGTDVARVDIGVLPTAPRFQDDMESGVAGYDVTGQWSLGDEVVCCPPPMPSDTHAWIFGNNGFFVGNGSLTTPEFEVSGLTEIDVEFWYCLSISRAYGLAFIAEISFDGGLWASIWPGVGVQTPNAWTQVPQIRVAIPAGAVEANLRFSVASRFGWGCIGIDDVMVSPIGEGGGNRPPTASAGPNQVDVCTDDVVHLDGTASSDPDFDVLTYNWTFTARPLGSVTTLANADTATPSFIPDVAGLYQVELEVDDGNGGTDTDIVNVTAIICGGAGLFFDDIEGGENGWAAGDSWRIVNNPAVGTASPTHVWQYAGGLYSGTASLVSRDINVAGQDTAIVQFNHYLSINPYLWFGTDGTSARLEASFDGGAWQEVRRWDATSPQNVWATSGAINVPVPGGSADMQIRFTFFSRLGTGGWWIDDVQVLGAAALGTLAFDRSGIETAQQSSFRIDSVGNSPNPIRDVHTTTFTVRGIGIEMIKVQIFDQAGRLAFDSGWQANDYDWHVESNTGETLANGIYLYIVTVRGVNGEIAVTETAKLAVYR